MGYVEADDEEGEEGAGEADEEEEPQPGDVGPGQHAQPGRAGGDQAGQTRQGGDLPPHNQYRSCRYCRYRLCYSMDYCCRYVKLCDRMIIDFIVNMTY